MEGARERVSLRGRGLVDPEVLDVLVGQLGRVELNAVQPRLHGHDRLVVVEEPDRRLLVKESIGLLQQLGALGSVIGLDRKSVV